MTTISDTVTRDDKLPQADALDVEHLEITYRVRGRGLRVVRDVSFRVGRGESFGLVGESGCGKSTIALGIVRYLARNGSVTGGKVEIDGVAVDVGRAAEVLAGWDRRADLGSVGTALWRETMAGFPDTTWREGKGLFATRFDPDDPVATPRGLVEGDSVVLAGICRALVDTAVTDWCAGAAPPAVP